MGLIQKGARNCPLLLVCLPLIASFWERPLPQPVWFQGTIQGPIWFTDGLVGPVKNCKLLQSLVKPGIPEGSMHQGNLTSCQIWQLSEHEP